MLSNKKKFNKSATQNTLATEKPVLHNSSFLKSIVSRQPVISLFANQPCDTAFEFIDELFEYFQFDFEANQDTYNRIPEKGGALIVANHPHGSLDGLSLIKFVQEKRTDIRIVANRKLMAFDALKPLTIPQGKSAETSILNALKNGEIVILFPANNIQEESISALKTRRWKTDFLSIARQSKAPIIPISIHTPLPAFQEFIRLISPTFKLFNHASPTVAAKRIVKITAGEEITVNKISNPNLKDRHIAKRLRKYIYKLPKDNQKVFVTEKPLAKPQETKKIIKELEAGKKLGETSDGLTIYLAETPKTTPLLKEIGRLRELTFRKVGEGTGAKRDIDKYDFIYRHLVLWNANKEQIVGAYRIGYGNELLLKHGVSSFYSSTLFNFKPEAIPYLKQSLELGRSFVHPDYWGKASLDYLWQGIGAIIRHTPDIKYLIGPVSISAEFPRDLISELVSYFEVNFLAATPLAEAKHPYQIPHELQDRAIEYRKLNQEDGMNLLQQQFKQKDTKIPVLFKQYTSLYEAGGIKLLSFNIDPSFGDCIDGLLLADITKLKAKKRQRYIERCN